MPILILTGPPGAGKSTTAAALVARFPRAVHLESDRFFQFIRSDYIEPWRPDGENPDEVSETLARRLDEGRLLI